MQDVQLLVFPEDSLLNSEEYSRKKLIEEILEEMPSPEKGGPLVNPCLEWPNDTSLVGPKVSVLRNMSCQARQYGIFLAVSLGDKVPCSNQTDPGCPADSHYLYNSIGLFNNEGAFVVKYHKMQLYYEFHYNIPSDCANHGDPVVYYDSPFGRLGFLICYDLLFQSPGIDLVEKYAVDTIIYSTYWFNYMPFVSAVQMQQAFAIAHRVNFLAADVQTGEGPNFGAGIYAASRGALAYSNTPDGQSKLIIATIPTNGKEGKSQCLTRAKKVVVSERGPTKQNNFMLNASLVKTIRLEHAFGQEHLEYCCPQSGLCCSLYYRVKNVPQFNREHFVLLVGNTTSGALGQERYPIRQEFCGLAACEDRACLRFAITSQTRFSFLHLSGILKSQHVYPSVMTSGLGLMPVDEWQYSTEWGQSTIIVRNASEPVVAVTIYGRLYEADPPYEH